MRDDQIKIIVKNNKVITLKELFEGKEAARKEMAGLPFEKKIRMLISLQEIAQGWGRKKDVRVWRV